MRLAGLAARSLRVFLASSGVLIWSAVPAHAQAARDIASRSLASVVLIATDDANGQPLALGSGFVIPQGIVTNVHVIRGASRGTAKLVGAQRVQPLGGILALDTLHDLVLLAAPNMAAPPLPLGDSRAMAVGDEVYALGNPQGLEGTFSQGIVSGIRTLGPDTLLQITAPISPGSSGGPVLNSKGEVIGVAVASFREGQNLNFAIPAAFLAPLLRGGFASAKPLSIVGPQRGAASRAAADVPSTAAVEGVLFRWKFSFSAGLFSVSLHNHLQQPVTNVVCIVVFYDSAGTPIDLNRNMCTHLDRNYQWVDGTRDTIPPRLSLRYDGNVNESVQDLTHRVEIRVLDFTIVR